VIFDVFYDEVWVFFVVDDVVCCYCVGMVECGVCVGFLYGLGCFDFWFVG